MHTGGESRRGKTSNDVIELVRARRRRKLEQR
jgi:hypothetical protein